MATAKRLLRELFGLAFDAARFFVGCIVFWAVGAIVFVGGCAAVLAVFRFLKFIEAW